MSAMEKSDSPEVAVKQANKVASAAAESVERRGGAKENAGLQNTVRTLSREAVSRAQTRVREAVTRNSKDKLTALLHHIDIDALRASFFGLKKSAAPIISSCLVAASRFWNTGLSSSWIKCEMSFGSGGVPRCFFTSGTACSG